MHRDYFRYDDPHRRRGSQSANLFWWSIVILLLTGMAFAAWIASFYIFAQPERPASYRILKKLHKVDPIKRFELTAAPAGEFLTAKQLYERYIAMSPTELIGVFVIALFMSAISAVLSLSRLRRADPAEIF